MTAETHKCDTIPVFRLKGELRVTGVFFFEEMYEKRTIINKDKFKYFFCL